MNAEAKAVEAILASAFDSVPCDHANHGKRREDHDSGPATHYVKAGCPSCDGDKEVFAACQRFVDVVKGWSYEFQCPRCRATGPASDFVIILAPVAS
ncbi:hypothetical protein SEA_BAUER_52 [Arthrobacter phage Bauer]|uniref:Uncharacterized protein n=1 Tax=Arthrobacter phage Bauer TaxID=2985648 RepID=A0A9E8AAE3_9CAUD|nr:hypothetical protein QEO99_gp52 [Arthrobacter phage Bauer]UYM26601.1 hypothetical protein SEA_BAUER_52 [Arthrobacter phage Bauer]